MTANYGRTFGKVTVGIEVMGWLSSKSAKFCKNIPRRLPKGSGALTVYF